MPKKYSVALLVGWDRARSINWAIDGRVDYDGNNDSWQLINTNLFEWRRCHLTPSYFRQNRRWALQNFDVIVNLISDSDQNPRTLDIATRITAPVRNRLINDPSRVRRTRREDISNALQDIPSLIVPRVIRLKRPTIERLKARLNVEKFCFPAIARRPGTHTGNVMGLFERPEDLQPALPADSGDLVLTEFKDFRSEDGLYRKMRFYSIGDEVIFRHLIFSDGWNVHARERGGVMLNRPDLQAEEIALINGGVHDILDTAHRSMVDIRKRIGLDYFGMDCAMSRDGRLIVFEVNATMNYLTSIDDPRYPYLSQRRKPAMEAMNALLVQRMRPQLAH